MACHTYDGSDDGNGNDGHSNYAECRFEQNTVLARVRLIRLMLTGYNNKSQDTCIPTVVFSDGSRTEFVIVNPKPARCLGSRYAVRSVDATGYHD